MINWEINTVGIDNFSDYIDRFPGMSRKAATMSINSGARKGRVLGKREIMRQVSLPSSYFGNEKSGRLRVSRWATEGNLEAAIRGRAEATSLLRFVTNVSSLHARGTSDTISAGRGTARLRVKPGSATAIDNAYILRLKGGNYGLAIRPGHTGVRGRYNQRYIGKGNQWALLYGPSVDQVFRTVRGDISPDVGSYVAGEFNRQFNRLITK